LEIKESGIILEVVYQSLVYCVAKRLRNLQSLGEEFWSWK